MSMDFYCLSGSPFSWKVWLALEHKHLAYVLHVLSADRGELKSPAFLAINPRGKVPVLSDGGFALYESAAIIEYLDEAYPYSGSPLWPKDVKHRALARRIACEADAYVYPHVRRLVAELIMRGAGEPDSGLVSESSRQLAAELSNLACCFRGPFASGSEPCAADFALYPLAAIIDRVHNRRPQYDVASVIPTELRAWMTAMEALAYFDKTRPPHWSQPA